MEALNVSGLKRRPDIIKNMFKRIGETTVVTEDIRIIFPDRYLKRELAFIGNDIKLLGIYAVVDSKGNYAVCSAPIMLILTPHSVQDIFVDGVLCKGLVFKKNDVFMPNVNSVISETFLYNIFDEFFIKGNVPWFLNYQDVSEVFLESGKYAGSGIGKNPVTFEILASVIARDPDDKQKYYRKSKTTKRPKFVGLNNVHYSYNTTGGKLIGGYFGYGTTVALMEQNKNKNSTIEEILTF